MSETTTLARIEKAFMELSSAKTLEDVLKIRDQAAAIRACVKAVSSSLHAANAAAEVKLRAERKAGEMLAAMELRGGDRKSKSHDVTLNLDDLGIDKMQSSRWQKEAAVDEDTFLEYIFACQAKSREVTQAGLLRIANGAHVGNYSGNSEWYTPHEYVDAVFEVMGSVDTDPCSCHAANSVVRAATFYDEADNGLEQEWHGSVFVNPPYGDGTVSAFAAKLLNEIDACRTTQAIFLVNNCTETKWFQSLVLRASALCFPCGRISFWSVDRNSKSPLQGQAVLYFGTHPQLFVEAFANFGFCTLLK